MVQYKVGMKVVILEGIEQLPDDCVKAPYPMAEQAGKVFTIREINPNYDGMPLYKFEEIGYSWRNDWFRLNSEIFIGGE